jgi:hypothetical protein
MRFAPLLACIALASPAFASSPMSIYVYPSRVEYLPDQANATQVVIHGAFFYYTQSFSYTSPACGKMFFACKPGEETMCRMQWNEIATSVGGQLCEGFGQQSMVTTAKFHAEGDALGAADTWDLGIGVARGSFVDGKCDPARVLVCSPVDMGHQPSDDPGQPMLGGGGCAIGGRAPLPAFALALLALAFASLARRRTQ